MIVNPAILAVITTISIYEMRGFCSLLWQKTVLVFVTKTMLDTVLF